jgi:uncharacterized protein YrrD
MRSSVSHLVGYAIRATDGELGSVAEFYFDDTTWTIRYLVVGRGGGHSARKVLISPAALGRPDAASRTVPVNLTMDQVRNSPSIDTDKPVSRQHEAELRRYYAWSPYWFDGPSPPGVHPATPLPVFASPLQMTASQVTAGEEPDVSTPAGEGDPHLRSTWHVTGYGIHASDGEIGHVKDFILDDETWAIFCLVVDTGKWLPGRKVLLAPAWIEQVSWADAMISVDLTRESVRNSPVYDPSQPVSAIYEARLYDHYGRPRKPS